MEQGLVVGPELVVGPAWSQMVVGPGLVVAEIIYKGIGNKSRAPYTLAILARPILARVNRTYVDQKRGRNCRLELKS